MGSPPARYLDRAHDPGGLVGSAGRDQRLWAVVGRGVNEGSRLAFGTGRFAIPDLADRARRGPRDGTSRVERARFVWGISLALVAVSGLGDLARGRPSLHASIAQLGRAGGWLGVVVGGTLARFIGPGGTVAALLAMLIIAFMIGTALGSAHFGHVNRRSPRPSSVDISPNGGVLDRPLQVTNLRVNPRRRGFFYTLATPTQERSAIRRRTGRSRTRERRQRRRRVHR